MEQGILVNGEVKGKRVRRSSSSAKDSKWFVTFLCYACIAFISVILFHQLLVALISWQLGYETHITFVKIDSKPYINEYWSNKRVLLLYAFPPGLLLLSAALVMSRLFLYEVRKIDKWYVLSFWWVVCSILYVTTQITVTPIAFSFGREELYTGIPVLANWFCLPAVMDFTLSVLSTFANLAMGLLFYKLIIQLSPIRTGVATSPKKQIKTIRLYFLYPLILLVPLGALLSYPRMPFFFMMFFINGLLWLPGLFIKAINGFGSESRLEKTEVEVLGIKQIAYVGIFILLIRIALFVIEALNKA